MSETLWKLQAWIPWPQQQNPQIGKRPSITNNDRRHRGDTKFRRCYLICGHHSCRHRIQRDERHTGTGLEHHWYTGRANNPRLSHLSPASPLSGDAVLLRRAIWESRPRSWGVISSYDVVQKQWTCILGMQRATLHHGCLGHSVRNLDIQVVGILFTITMCHERTDWALRFHVCYKW